MFIQCSECDYKYIVNSADLKPEGRMVECANCNHRWYQEPLRDDNFLSSSVPIVPKEEIDNNLQNNKKDEHKLNKEIKNLPSTVVREKKVSLLNTFLVIFFLVFLFFLFWAFRSYGTNIFVLLKFYINEFFFNLRLIIDDLAKIIYQILN
tara:strand:+ start:12409 stop:12858 length:450 start_codon:yes stop_codon:yes gene_type:complete